ncbi:MAG: hypothetical protein JWL84_2501 [Rhodospirillales bacterium]|nr:hypothetical protein [Rhodospirillales bacterium]
MTDVAQVSPPLPATPPQATASTDPAHLWKDKSFGFHDLLDIINPLQHIPIIATVYRYLTGDTIGNVARVAGDALYGGPIGMAAGVVSAGVQIETGKDIGDHVVALLTGDDVPAGPAPIVTAAASPTDRPVTTAAVTTTPAAAAPFARLAAKTPAATIDDARQAFIARVEAKRQQSTGDGRTLSNRVVPLEGPAGSMMQRRVIGSPFTAAPAGAPARSIVQPADAATSPAIRASLATPDGPAAATPSMPGNPPINISQQMLDALDKYARMEQQKRADEKRGAQLDTVH